MRSSPDVPLPDRATVLAVVTETMDRSTRRWAWQGPTGASARWVSESSPKDLDIWCDANSPDDHPEAPAAAIRHHLTCATIADARDPGRLRHHSVAIETGTGLAVLDITFGDLRVGPVLLVPAGEIEVEPAAHRLTGASSVADLLVRPILRGRWPGPAELAEARAAWAGMASAVRRRLTDRLTSQLGASVVDRLVAALDGAEPHPGTPRRARQRLAALSIAPANVAATWKQRWSVVPAGRAAGPLGLRMRGVVVAMIGTDGAGKSTVAHDLAQRLARYGLTSGSAYFGMAHGNLPGVRLARRLLGVSAPATTPATTAPATTTPATTTPATTAPAPREYSAAREHPDRPAHPRLRRLAAWYYAVEYGWRYLRIAGLCRRRRIVIVDRWVYDLRESPWPGSRAARVAERLVPDPDVLVLPDAPAELIHSRKPERPLAEQAAQQERYRRLLAERPARHAEVVVDTGGSHADPLGGLVAAVLEAAHAPRARRRRP